MYHILYQQLVSRRHLICIDIEIRERFSAKSKSQRSAVVMASWYDSDGQVNLHTTASYRFGIVQYFLKHAYRIDVSDEPSMKYTDHLFANVTWYGKHPKEKNHFPDPIRFVTNSFEIEGLILYTCEPYSK